MGVQWTVSPNKALAHLRRDPVLRRLIRQIGPYAIEYAPANFATLARCIVYQQVSGKVAAKLYARLQEAVATAGELQPADVLQASREQLRAVGLSRSKIHYLRSLAEACMEGRLRLEELSALPDEEVIRILTRLPGIGLWTVQMYLIFALKRPDVLPSTDLGIRVAVQQAYQLAQLPTPKQVERLGEPWHPYATVASWYLWRSLGDGAGLY